jgi:hypothetical protein
MLMPTEPESRRHDYLWALAVPIIMVIVAGLLGLLFFRMLGAGYYRAIFGSVS